MFGSHLFELANPTVILANTRCVCVCMQPYSLDVCAWQQTCVLCLWRAASKSVGVFNQLCVFILRRLKVLPAFILSGIQGSYCIEATAETSSQTQWKFSNGLPPPHPPPHTHTGANTCAYTYTIRRPTRETWCNWFLTLTRTPAPSLIVSHVSSKSNFTGLRRNLFSSSRQVHNAHISTSAQLEKNVTE